MLPSSSEVDPFQYSKEKAKIAQKGDHTVK